MKIFACFIILCMVFSCQKEKNTPRLGLVSISQITIPDNVNQEFIQISAKAQANNGCWSNLYFELSRQNDFEYSIKAYGTFSGNNVCPEILIYKDTVFQFQPPQKGVYRFTISRNPSNVETEIMVVE